MHTTSVSFFFFFNDPAPTEIYPLPLHDALPIWFRTPLISLMLKCAEVPALSECDHEPGKPMGVYANAARRRRHRVDRKSTRLNSSHLVISYAVFCLKKKKQHAYWSLAGRARSVT